MENIRCKSCGGTVVRERNHYVCEFCENRWEIDRADDVYAVDRANAWAALRNGDFEKATESFEALLTKDPDNYEAHWGCALSMNGIIYVDDIHENKRVPTCNNITETSFLKSHHLTKAISLAPEDIAGSYRQQSESIEKIRLEWLEKASKEPPYDVFICFKDSDRENGIERTQDSIDAQDLYNALVAEKFRVFYSRVSLRDKISEQYEPYIYNAIKTAKVMIVFGEKPEYFSATWLKNEWSRFRLRMEKGEKHPNSLVVVYKNMNPGDLPAALKSRQCLNASDMTFFSDLSKHIKRVIAEQGEASQLERVELKGGRVSKKADRIASETIQVREIGSHAVTEIDISEKQQLSLVYSFINARQWKDASKQIDDILFNNPNNAEALWCRLLVKHNLQKNEALAQALPGMRKEDFALIEKVLNCADANLAATVLDTLYALRDKVGEAPYLELLQTILPFNYEGRSAAIEACFARAIKAGNYRVFRLLLTTLDSEDVDRYIEYHIAYAKQAVKLKNTKQFEECIAAVLAVDNGNPHALLLRWTARIETAPLPELIALTEELLQYSSDPDHVVDALLQSFSQKLKNKTQCALAKQIIKYYQGNLKKIEQTLVALAHKMIEERFFEDAESILNLVQNVDKNLPEVYWYLCLAKARATMDSEIVKSWKLVKKLPEYTKYLALVDEKRRQECMKLVKEQTKHKTKGMVFLSCLATIALLALITVCWHFLQRKRPYDDALEMMENEEYAEAIIVLEELRGFLDSEMKIAECRYRIAVSLMEENKLLDAIPIFELIRDYQDSNEKLSQCYIAVFGEKVWQKIKDLDFLLYNGNAYFVFDLQYEHTWYYVESYCWKQGGHLATISNQEENDALYSYIVEQGYNSAYFGYTDQYEEGTWEWVTSERINYTNWHSGEPNSEREDEDYAMFYHKYRDGTWNDGSWAKVDKAPFICEWEGLNSNYP